MQSRDFDIDQIGDYFLIDKIHVDRKSARKMYAVNFVPININCHHSLCVVYQGVFYIII